LTVCFSGAQLHHFPSKEELVTAAIEHCHERRMPEGSFGLT
jgi:hypothetical protein